MQYCSLLSPPNTSTTECHVCFGPAASFFLELLVITLHSTPVAYWAPGRGGVVAAHLLASYVFVLFMRFLEQESWNVLPFPPPEDHVWSELFTMTYPSCEVLHGMARSFTELHKPLHHKKALLHEGSGNH